MKEYNRKINCRQQDYGMEVEVYDRSLSRGHALVHQGEIRETNISSGFKHLSIYPVKFEEYFTGISHFNYL